MSGFEDAFEAVVGVEGGYSNNPDDSGGPTKYGVTQAVARRHGYEGDMRDYPLEAAHAVYRADYWDLLKLDDVDALSDQIALEMFDTAVNTGAYYSAWWTQRILNAFNKGGTLYPDITADAHMGPFTIDALRRYLDFRKDEGEDVFLKAFNSLQGAYYVACAEHNMRDETFCYGWIKNRVQL